VNSGWRSARQHSKSYPSCGRTFREDDCRVRKGHAPENLALLRHIAVNAIKQEKSAKLGVKNKRLKAGWDNSYLAKILLGI
jgi:hypothetical protein